MNNTLVKVYHGPLAIIIIYASRGPTTSLHTALYWIYFISTKEEGELCRRKYLVFYTIIEVALLFMVCTIYINLVYTWKLNMEFTLMSIFYALPELHRLELCDLTSVLKCLKCKVTRVFNVSPVKYSIKWRVFIFMIDGKIEINVIFL